MSVNFAAGLERELRRAIVNGATPSEIRMARALIDVHAVDVSAYRRVGQAVEVAVGAAARLDAKGILPSQVRRLYGNGGGTYDMVREVVFAAS